MKGVYLHDSSICPSSRAFNHPGYRQPVADSLTRLIKQTLEFSTRERITDTEHQSFHFKTSAFVQGIRTGISGTNLLIWFARAKRIMEAYGRVFCQESKSVKVYSVTERVMWTCTDGADYCTHAHTVTQTCFSSHLQTLTHNHSN